VPPIQPDFLPREGLLIRFFATMCVTRYRLVAFALIILPRGMGMQSGARIGNNGYPVRCSVAMMFVG
jgi:hypothetical protein